MLNIGQNIRRIREIKNLTQEAVAELAGMSVSAFGNIERGDTDVNFRKLADIAEALQVKEEEIVTFGATTYNNTVHNHENSTNPGQSIGSIGTSNTYTIDKDLLDKMLKDKDEEIAYLREQVRKG
jgi:transcriptional regulator with XRE-family HTH domain